MPSNLVLVSLNVRRKSHYLVRGELSDFFPGTSGRTFVGMRIGIVGATGQVGGVMRRSLAERKFPVDQLRLFASARSAGRTLPWQDGAVTVEGAAPADYRGLDIVLFSAGQASSQESA